MKGGKKGGDTSAGEECFCMYLRRVGYMRGEKGQPEVEAGEIKGRD